MIRNTFFIGAILSACLISSCCSQQQEEPKGIVAQNFEVISQQLPVAFASIEKTKAELKASGKLKEGLQEQLNPRSLNADGSLNLVGIADWTCGFFPGTVWLAYEYTQDPALKEQAIKYTDMLEGVQYRTTTHDLGFMVNCSYGNGIRLADKEEYVPALVQAGKSLLERYDPKVGLIRSWDHNKEVWNYPVIIDNMMNLEMLCRVSRLTGDNTYRDVAIKHADKTLQNHFRDDYSSVHVVDYSPTGEVNLRQTFQGCGDDSSWARGQGWGLYGYTMMFREIGDKRYLEQAKNIANYIMTNSKIPTDKVPYWDYDAPNIPDEPRDVSAATLTASALYELSMYVPEKAAEYKKYADQIIETVTEKFTSKVGENHGFVTTDSTGHFPVNSEIAVPINYADYYFLEALIRKDKLENGKSAI